MDPSKIQAVQDWPKLNNVKDVQSFIGFANFYRRFIKNYSTIINPLTNLIRKHVKFIWDDNVQNSFDILKKAFVSAPIL
jgi:hypothetical protein